MITRLVALRRPHELPWYGGVCVTKFPWRDTRQSALGYFLPHGSPQRSGVGLSGGLDSLSTHLEELTKRAEALGERTALHAFQAHREAEDWRDRLESRLRKLEEALRKAEADSSGEPR
jgi:hypothetical protein